eukprot:4047152-Pyramimonas_sp.AAC.1
MDGPCTDNIWRRADKRTEPHCVNPNGYEVEKEEEVVEHGSSGESEAFWSLGGPPRSPRPDAAQSSCEDCSGYGDQ